MKMRASDISAYPRFAAFLPGALAAACADDRKLASFRKYSGLNPAQAANALTKTNTLPLIRIGTIGLGPRGGPALGKFDPRFRSEIAIAIDVVAQFELDHERPIARQTVEAVVLHEMVHWGDMFDDRQETRADIGMLFEWEAYRKWHPRWYDPPVNFDTLAVTDGSRLVFPLTGQIGGGTAYWGRNIRAGGTRSHDGIDIFNDVGTPVYAAADGRVEGGERYRVGARWADQLDNYGQMIDIDHGNGLLTRYAHLDTVEVRPGLVRRGTRIGTLGATGTEWGAWLRNGRPGSPPTHAARPHLHFEMRKSDGVAFGNFDDTFDPATFFDFIAPGAGARNTVVAGLRPGVVLDRPVPAATEPASEMPAGIGAVPTGYRGAYPNRSYAPDDPRGLRNNNPGNLRKDGTDWAGLRTAELQLDEDFFQFIAVEWGIRAMARTLRTYQTRHAIRTLRDMSGRWAPYADHNDALQHAQNVLAHARGAISSIDAQVDFTSVDTVFGVIRGIAVAENGALAETIPDDIVRLGIELERNA